MSYPGGRHKNRNREYPSGSQKAKLNIEKEQKIAEEIQTTRKVTDLSTAPRPILPCHNVDIHSSDSGSESSDDGDGHVSSSSSPTRSEAAAEYVEDPSEGPITGIGMWPRKPGQSMVSYRDCRRHGGLRMCKIASASESNREVMKRPWRCYSPTTSCVYCFHCKLIGANGMLMESALIGTGCDDWTHWTRYFRAHETSFIVCKTL